MEEDNLVVCRECGFKGKHISTHIKWKHGLSKEQYQIKYPGAPIFCQSLKKDISTRIKKNNPMSNPISRNKIKLKYQNKTLDEKENLRKQNSERQKGKSLLERGHKPNCKCSYCKQKRHEKYPHPVNCKCFRCSKNFFPTETECMLMAIIQLHDLPFTYTGDFRFKIETLNPDFIHFTEQVVIEVNGTVHDSFNTGRTKEEEEQNQINKYNSKGWECIVIWEEELDDPEKLLNKLRPYF